MSVTLSLRSRAGSERSEGSGSTGGEILRFAQDDSKALRMTARTPLQSASEKPYLQTSRKGLQISTKWRMLVYGNASFSLISDKKALCMEVETEGE